MNINIAIYSINNFSIQLNNQNSPHVYNFNIDLDN